jgi:hypothetical protein
VARLFGYTGVDEDYRNDDVDLGMATTSLVNQSPAPA